MKITLVVLSLLCTSLGLPSQVPKNNVARDDAIPPEIGMDVEELIAFHGFQVEAHEVQTEDGYILKIHRIPNEGKPAALLVPGFFCSSSMYVMQGPENSLAFILADAGYDVWLMNVRGTTHSRKHVTLDPDVDLEKFWDFSFHEMGYYDLPASVDYVLHHTNQEDLYYIGHSQGTTNFFIMAATRPEYNSKVRVASMLAPIAYMDHSEHELVRLFADNYDFLLEMVIENRWYELLPHFDTFTEFGRDFCKDGDLTQEVCMYALEVFFGSMDEKQINKTMIPIMLSSIPAGSSYKQGAHYLQEYLTGRFGQFDYGVLGNIEIYGSPNAPEYDVSKIISPVALFIAPDDMFADRFDVDRLTEALPNVILKYYVEDENFGHLDFIMAMDVRSLVYDKILRIFSEH